MLKVASPINVLLVTPAEPVPELFATAAASGEVVVAAAHAFEAALSALRESFV